MATDPTITLATPITALRGVGPERNAQLARLGIHRVGDLLLHKPRRYEDRRAFISIAQLQVGSNAAVSGQIVDLGLKRFARGRKSVFEIHITDGSGRLHCRWWNMPYLDGQFTLHEHVMVYGKIKSEKPLTIDHPEFEVIGDESERMIHLNRIVPIYPLTEGLPQRSLRRLIFHLLFESNLDPGEPWNVPSTFPPFQKALHDLHFPERLEDADLAVSRLAFDELLAFQLELQRRRIRLEQRARSTPCGGTNELNKPFVQSLPFKLTEAQTHVLREIRADMSRSVPMRRLLQGDVGSGKTVVAACAALMALESAQNALLMAPTEILAEQHFNTFQKWFAPLGVEVRSCTGSQKTIPKSPDKPQFVVGTHALTSERFELERLGLVIIDEQHKFGVAQREQLVKKGNFPHLLVMTATPIPRTLGLTLYGDLDISVIEQLPGGRKPIRTFVRGSDKLPHVLEFTLRELRKGHQAYLVYPRVEESSDGQVKAVLKEARSVQKQFTPFKVGVLHGKLSGEEKKNVMEQFRLRQLHLLLVTSMAEVGLDVPNATVMLVENAEQFGLAQLHQLRGRIGRGPHESYCILVSDAANEEAGERLKVLAETTDGFKIAEADLKLRGPGELLGREQSGLPEFKFANLDRDLPLVIQSRDWAREMLKQEKEDHLRRLAGPK